MAKIPGFGPACLPELRAVGIRSADDIRRLGWVEAFERWTARFPARINVNSGAAMFAAEQGISWLRVTPEDKDRVRTVVKRLKTRCYTEE